MINYNSTIRIKREKSCLYLLVKFLKRSAYLSQFTTINSFNSMDEAKEYRASKLLNKRGKPLDKKVKCYKIIPFN